MGKCDTRLEYKNSNVVIAADIKNGDVLNGPNFVDPEHGDYRIRPSLQLLDQGNNDKYQQNVGLKKIYKDKSNQDLDYARCLPQKRT